MKSVGVSLRRGDDERSHLGFDKQTIIVVWIGTISQGQKRHGPLQIDLVGFCRGGHLRKRTRETLEKFGSRKTVCSSWFRCDTVKN
jgi:hypothetical protein